VKTTNTIRVTAAMSVLVLMAGVTGTAAGAFAANRTSVKQGPRQVAPESGTAAPLIATNDGVLRFRPARPAGGQVKVAATPDPVRHPLSAAVCRQRYGLPCYGLPELSRAYGLDRLHRDGATGEGTTVALIMPFHDPHLKSAVSTYSRQYKLGEPRLTVVRHGSGIRTVDPADPMMLSAAVENELDSEMIRTTAPDARIEVIEVPGTWAPTSDMGTAANTAVWAARHIPNLGVVSMSYGWGEPNYRERNGGGLARLREQNAALHRAAGLGVTEVAATGDDGATTGNLAETAYYKRRAVYFPASSPDVTGVAGTELHLSDTGVRRARDTLWTDSDGQGTATGGGVSEVFGRPRWQPRALGSGRSVGDIALNASSRSRAWFYTPYSGVFPGQGPGWDRVAGTSASAPLMAGLVADAAAEAGHGLGNVNPALAGLRSHAGGGVLDVVKGCNTAHDVPGWCAADGPDTPTGVGTVGDASAFVGALAHSA
jgi:kumamolisin